MLTSLEGDVKRTILKLFYNQDLQYHNYNYVFALLENISVEVIAKRVTDLVKQTSIFPNRKQSIQVC